MSGYRVGAVWCDEHPVAERRDPDYDDPPEPFDWRELRDPRVFIGGLICFIGFCAFMVLILTLVPGPLV